MGNRKQSARERTGLFLLAAVLAGVGGGNAAAAPQKKASTVQKKSVAAQKTAGKKSVTVQKTAKTQPSGARKAAAAGPKSGTAKKSSDVAGGAGKKGSAGRQVSAAVTDPKEVASAGATGSTKWKTGSSAPENAAAAMIAGQDLPFGQEDKFRPTLSTDYVPSDLTKVPAEITMDGKAVMLREEAVKSMEAMFREAASDGVTLKVVSGYRDYAHQNRLYQSALKRHGRNQKMVGRPGRSEHFLGTTVDVSNTNPKHLLRAEFGKSAEYRWLEENAPRYGWKFTVRAGVNGRLPHQDEPWHIRYMGGWGSGERPAAPVIAPDFLERLWRFLDEKKQAPVELASAAVRKVARAVDAVTTQ